MKLQILGCYAATPRTITNPTSQVLDIKNHLFLIDCGEGTQVQLRKHKIKFSRINHIFISHLHGDHFYGLIGLISTFMLLNRENDLHVYGPKGIKEIILLQLRASGSFTGYNLYFHELESKESEVIFEDDAVIVKMGNLSQLEYVSEKIDNSNSFIVDGNEYFIPFGDSIDVNAERAKLQEELNYTKGFLVSVQKKLQNEKFMAGAPEVVVVNERNKEADALGKIAILEDKLKSLN